MRVPYKRDKYRYIRLVVRFINETLRIDQNTNFCVDTGAPYSVVSHEQALQWEIPFDRLQRTQAPHRIGGIEAHGYKLEDSKILFRDFTGKLYSFAIPRIVVLGPPFQHQEGRSLPVPALLGDDILRHFTLIVESDARGGRIILTDE